MHIDTALIATTERLLAEAGRRGEEGLVLWLGNDDVPSQVYQPRIQAGPRHFRVVPDEQRRLIAHCSNQQVRLLAQVHSHPNAAFHSDVDNRDALVRRLGGLSIVLPRFAVEGFRAPDWKAYQLTDQGWREVSRTVITW
ncbi:MAG TPA: Mov34/MPN/PAD-1 family protein [Chloroflexota bacterium]